MLIFCVSDLHNEIAGRNRLLDIKHGGRAKESILVVAGDLNSKGRSIKDIEEIAHLWHSVIFVPGNHDFWGLSLQETHKHISNLPNVHTLQNQTVEFNNVVFVGTTLWHSFSAPLSHFDWKRKMNDAKKIRGPKWCRLTSAHIQEEHNKAVDFIQSVRTPKRKVLITHHAICPLSIPDRYVSDPDNEFYCCNKTHLLDGYDYHIHGHIHSESDYEVYGCRVVCNPGGYPGELELNEFIIEV